MRYLTLNEVLELHQRVIEQTGGPAAVRDFGALQSAVAQPRMSFGGADLYPTIQEKAAAICLSLVKNHPFLDGNKRVGHAALETFLVLNGHEIASSIDDSERVILGVASGAVSREQLVDWLKEHVVER